jgi:plasmid stabilization system protein ParE
VARIEASRVAADDIARLCLTHSLPPDTNERIRRSLRSLEQFPRLGTALEADEWAGLRFVLGPWRWMVIVYEIDEESDRVVVVTVQDGRSSTPATAPG